MLGMTHPLVTHLEGPYFYDFLRLEPSNSGISVGVQLQRCRLDSGSKSPKVDYSPCQQHFFKHPSRVGGNQYNPQYNFLEYDSYGKLCFVIQNLTERPSESICQALQMKKYEQISANLPLLIAAPPTGIQYVIQISDGEGWAGLQHQCCYTSMVKLFPQNVYLESRRSSYLTNKVAESCAIGMTFTRLTWCRGNGRSTDSEQVASKHEPRVLFLAVDRLCIGRIRVEHKSSPSSTRNQLPKCILH